MKRITTNPKDPRLNRKDPDGSGMDEAYLVLPEKERKKGFIRPYRDKYIHVGRNVCGKLSSNHSQIPNHPELDMICVLLPNHKGECTAWTKKENIKGCGASTTMGRALSETYARNPKFYGATFCVTCGDHFPVSEFKWSVDGRVVGS